MSLLATINGRGLLASRPAAAAANEAYNYYGTDTGILYRSNGSSWDVNSSGFANPMTTSQDIIVGGSSGTPGRLAKGADGTVLGVVAGSLAYATPGGGGSTYGQSVPYPTSFTGDTINGSSTTPFVDVAAFDTKDVLNSRILRLITLGASKDQRVRVTLGTTKAGAFDVRVVLMVNGDLWATNGDYYAEVRLSTSADAQIAIARVMPMVLDSAASPYVYGQKVRVGGSSITAADTTIEPAIPFGQAVMLRFVRDGSNIIIPSYGAGQAPMALSRFQNVTARTPYSATVSGTLARIEIAQHSPSGPGGTAFIETFVDYVASV